MARPPRPCLEPGCPNLANASRCPAHTRNLYGGPWRRLSRDVIAAHRAMWGDWCPGYGTAGHVAADLTVDHVVAGTTTGGVRVLCRSCNSRKGNG